MPAFLRVVVDEQGRALAGVSLSSSPPFEIGSDFGRVLDNSQLMNRESSTDARGNFHLAVPALPSGTLQFRSEGFATHVEPLPQQSLAGLQISMRPLRPAEGSLRGVVTDQQSAKAETCRLGGAIGPDDEGLPWSGRFIAAGVNQLELVGSRLQTLHTNHAVRDGDIAHEDSLLLSRRRLAENDLQGPSATGKDPSWCSGSCVRERDVHFDVHGFRRAQKAEIGHLIGLRAQALLQRDAASTGDQAQHPFSLGHEHKFEASIRANPGCLHSGESGLIDHPPTLAGPGVSRGLVQSKQVGDEAVSLFRAQALQLHRSADGAGAKMKVLLDPMP